MALLLLPPLHWLLYAILLRLAFGLTRLRAALVALLREAVGAVLYLGILSAPGVGGTFATALLVTAPLAWALVAPLDPHRSLRRFWRWVLLGSLTSLAVNAVVLGALMGHTFFDSRSLRIISG